VIAAALVLVASAAVAWWAGMDPGHAVAVGAACAVAVLLWRAAPAWDAAEWTPAVRTVPPGTRDDVTRLAWSLAGDRGRGGAGSAGGASLRRLRVVARNRLAAHGLDLDDLADREQIVALVGAGAYDVVRPGPSATVRRGDFAACLAAFARLDPVPSVPSPAPSSTPSPTGEPRAR
jgi:hypothetical protein